MHILSIKNLYFQYPNTYIPVFDNQNFTFEAGWNAIVGANGSGKTTLLKIIAKQLPVDPPLKDHMSRYYCMQSTEAFDDTIEDFMQTYNAEAIKMRDVLGIKEVWLYRYNALSQGEKKRMHIGAALYTNPDILLLDEPTNHLDIKSKTLVINALQNYKGIGILVSHDRELLDTLSKATYILQNGSVRVFKTHFSAAQKELEQQYAFDKKTQDIQNNALKKIKKQMQQIQQKVDQSSKRLSKRHLDIHDSDTREKINGARLTGKDKSDAKLIKRTVSKYDHIASNAHHVEKVYETCITLKAAPRTKLFPIVIPQKTVHISPEHTIEIPRLSIESSAKIGIIGENGAGKSSFVNDLLNTISARDQVLYIPQEITQRETKALFEEIQQLNNTQKGEIMTIIRKLASNPNLLLQSKLPSPGEIRKLMIAKGLLAHPALILLDEPTNHMDITSIMALENALVQYDGAVLIVSHDKPFVDAIATEIWAFEAVGKGRFAIREG